MVHYCHACMDLFLGPIWTINDYNIYNIGEGICIVSHCWLISAFNWWIWCELAMYFQQLASLNLHVLRCFSLEVTFQIEAMLHLKVCKLRLSHILARSSHTPHLRQHFWFPFFFSTISSHFSLAPCAPHGPGARERGARDRDGLPALGSVLLRLCL